MLRPQTWYLLLAAVSILVCLIAGAGTTLQVVLLIVAALAALAVIFIRAGGCASACRCGFSVLLRRRGHGSGVHPVILF